MWIWKLAPQHKGQSSTGFHCIWTGTLQIDHFPHLSIPVGADWHLASNYTYFLAMSWRPTSNNRFTDRSWTTISHPTSLYFLRIYQDKKPRFLFLVLWFFFFLKGMIIFAWRRKCGEGVEEISPLEDFHSLTWRKHWIHFTSESERLNCLAHHRGFLWFIHPFRDEGRSSFSQRIPLNIPCPFCLHRLWACFFVETLKTLHWKQLFLMYASSTGNAEVQLF